MTGDPASRVMETPAPRPGEPPEYSQCRLTCIPGTHREVARRDRSIRRVGHAQPGPTSGDVLEALFADEPGHRTNYAAIRTAERIGELRNPSGQLVTDVRGGSSRRCRRADSGKATHQVFLENRGGSSGVEVIHMIKRETPCRCVGGATPRPTPRTMRRVTSETRSPSLERCVPWPHDQQ